MSTTESIKEEARRHEQREEWPKALDLYLQVIETQAESEEPDIALYNRVGDLQVRIGDLDGAIENYETAIDLYLDAGLPNNAIAICRKIIRNAPRRAAPYLRMGQIRAAQGFVVDARQNFVTYAEMKQADGDTDEAVRALEEFVGMVQDDVETRLFLADQMGARDREADAVQHLLVAHRTLSANGETEQAEAVLGRIHELDPDRSVFEPEADAVDVERDRDDADGLVAGFESTSLGGDFAVDEFEVAESEADKFESDEEVDEVEEDEETVVVERLSFGELTLAGDETELEEAPDAMDDAPSTMEDAPPTPPQDLEVAADEVALPTLDLSGNGPDEADVEADVVGVEGFDDVYVEADAESDVEAGDFEAEQQDEVVEEVARSTADLETEFSADPVEPLRARVAEDANDADAWKELGEVLVARGEREEGTAALERARVAYAEAGWMEMAMETARELLRHAPERIELRQKVVEYAHRTNDRGALVEAFLELAGGLHERGESRKAEAVYRQVLSLDPENVTALHSLPTELAPSQEPDEDEVKEPTVEAEVPSSTAEDRPGSADDYVDLGALVLDEDGPGGGTRWRVPAGTPSGDEEADFALMLQQFKEKVSENLASDDATAHYDLGMAYKEMGLLDEAIGEFQGALRANPKSLATFEMLGQCFLDRGEPEAAVRTLERGLQLPIEVEDELLGVYYFLARSHEALERSDVAREFYTKIFSLDINFKDVTERLKALR